MVPGQLNRRSVLKNIGLTSLAALLWGSTATADPGGKKLPKGLAKKAATKQVVTASQQSGFSEWSGADVGKSVTYYRKNAGKGPAYLRSAYVFPVMDGANSVGYVTTAARRTEGLSSNTARLNHQTNTLRALEILERTAAKPRWFHSTTAA